MKQPTVLAFYDVVDVLHQTSKSYDQLDQIHMKSISKDKMTYLMNYLLQVKFQSKWNRVLQSHLRVICINSYKVNQIKTYDY